MSLKESQIEANKKRARFQTNLSYTSIDSSARAAHTYFVKNYLAPVLLLFGILCMCFEGTRRSKYGAFLCVWFKYNWGEIAGHIF